MGVINTVSTGMMMTQWWRVRGEGARCPVLVNSGVLEWSSVLEWGASGIYEGGGG